MPKVCFILVAGLDGKLLSRANSLDLKALAGFAARVPIRPVWPAVTCTMQATLTTGRPASGHGIIANGLYAHNRRDLWPKFDLSNNAEFRRNVSFWEQSNALLEAPRFWAGSGKKVAMLFWQNSMGGAADIVLTPKPEHTPDGKTLTACWSDPTGLYGELSSRLGPFPLMNYWSPMAGLPSSAWIVEAAMDVWKRFAPDLQLVYIPHMDFNLQRLGPSHPTVLKDLQDVDGLLGKLVEAVRASGGVPIVCGDYGMSDVTTAVLPNLALRQAGLLATIADVQGKALVNYERSEGFAMVDHQVAHVYCKPGRKEEIAGLLALQPGVSRVILDRRDLAALGLDHPRSGDLVLLAAPHAWFCHDWWKSDAEKPVWQFSVDIHRKPGYDPRELFFDPQRKCIAQNPSLVKGSHGLVTDTAADWPVLLCDQSHAAAESLMDATAVAGLLQGLL